MNIFSFVVFNQLLSIHQSHQNHCFCLKVHTPLARDAHAEIRTLQTFVQPLAQLNVSSILQHLQGAQNEALELKHTSQQTNTAESSAVDATLKTQDNYTGLPKDKVICMYTTKAAQRPTLNDHFPSSGSQSHTFLSAETAKLPLAQHAIRASQIKDSPTNYHSTAVYTDSGLFCT